MSEPSKKLRRLSESSLSLIEDPGGQAQPLPDPCLPSTSSYHHHHEVPLTPETGDDDSTHLLSLPLLVLTNIIDDLDVADVNSLRLVNKFLLKMTESRYIRSVRLSASPPSTPASSPSSSSLSVLALEVTYNLSQLPTDLMTYPAFSQLNLRKLKQLKVTGKNHIWNKQYLLSEIYKDTLEKLLNNKTYRHSLRKLEILMDESRRSIEIVKLCQNFPNLHEVTLHGIGYFDTGSYHMDKDVAQFIISSVLEFTKIKILNLKSFGTLNRCIVIESDTLEELTAEFGKHFEIGLLYLPVVKKITLETSMWAGCFSHAQNGELKKIVAQGCPRLETFNTIDLEALASRSPTGRWLDMVGQYCASLHGSSEASSQCVICTSGN